MERNTISTRRKDRKATLMPNGVPKYVRCYTNNGETFDEYTVCYTGKYRKPLPDGLRDSYTGRMEWFQYVGMSTHPFHPQGFGQHGESISQIDVNKWGFAPAVGRKNHLGVRIPFETLPSDCKRLVISDYRALWNI